MGTLTCRRAGSARIADLTGPRISWIAGESTSRPRAAPGLGMSAAVRIVDQPFLVGGSADEESAAADLRSWRQLTWIGLPLLVVPKATDLSLNLYVTLLVIASIRGVFVLTPFPRFTSPTLSSLLWAGCARPAMAVGPASGDCAGGLWGSFPRLWWRVQEGFVITFTRESAFSFGMEMGFLGAMILCGTMLVLASPPLSAGWAS
jgi:hypothetical protein